MFLNISQTSQENTCVGTFFMKLQACKFFKKGLQHKCFPVKICEPFKNTYFEGYLQTTGSGGVLLKVVLKNFAILTGGRQLVISVLWKRCSWWLIEH